MLGGCRQALLGMQQEVQHEPRCYPVKLDLGYGTP